LTSAAAQVSENMIEAKQVQEEILESQKSTLNLTANIKKENDDLVHAVSQVKDIFADFQ